MAKGLYERYHKNTRHQTKIIKENNFTYVNVLRVLKHVLDNNEIKSVLDIGCGAGTIDFYLASKGFNVTGVDISEIAINAAKSSSKLMRLDSRLKFIKTSFPSKKIKGKYDLVIISEVLEHLHNEDQVLKKIHTLLKSGGIMVLSVPSNNAPLYKLGCLATFDEVVGHLRRYSVGGLKNKIIKNRFVIKDIMKTEGVFRNFLFTNKVAGNLIRFFRGPFLYIFVCVDDFSVKLFGESQIFVIASKK